MHVPFSQVIIFLIAGILSIILLTVKLKVHPFFALLIACFITGVGVGIPIVDILQLIRTGFGDVVSKLFLLIVLGTSIGALLEKNGSTRIMADYILKKVGSKRSSFALSLTGFIVGLPIFCDSGYIVLNGINKSLTRQTGIAIAQMSISLGSGLYAVHCLIPPHPGATAAAILLETDIGKLILIGLLIAIPAMLVGHGWAVFAGSRTMNEVEHDEEEDEQLEARPSVFLAFLPIIVPILLMAIKSMATLEESRLTMLLRIINLMGDPSVALAVGLLIAILITKNKKHTLSHNLAQAIEKAASILIIIGAGGAFGAVLAGTNIAAYFNNAEGLRSLGIWFPFLITCILKTAQGSSTVAIITASSIVLPLLNALGLDSENGRILAVLSMGAGSMMISHTNDAYFWVISRFSGIGIRNMLKVHSVASILMGLTTMIIVYILSFFIL